MLQGYNFSSFYKPLFRLVLLKADSYLRHLFKAEEMLAMRLAVMHNLWFYNTLMERIRDARLVTVEKILAPADGLHGEGFAAQPAQAPLFQPFQDGLTAGIQNDVRYRYVLALQRPSAGIFTVGTYFFFGFAVSFMATEQARSPSTLHVFPGAAAGGHDQHGRGIYSDELHEWPPSRPDRPAHCSR